VRIIKKRKLYLPTGTEQNGSMAEKSFSFTINQLSELPKYQQLVNSINEGIAKNELQIGDLLPSVNYLCKAYKLSRDTVFKAYSILKEQGVIDSVPNKGYFVAGDLKRVLLVLDTFKAYKEVLYDSFINQLPDNVITDVQFHHYQIDNFKAILNNSKGKYYKYIVMPFDNKAIPDVLSELPEDKLLIIDWDIHSKAGNNFVCQDFGAAFLNAIRGAADLFRKYREIHFVYPKYTYHSIETVNFFKKFCKEYDFLYKIITNPKDFVIEKNTAYISVSDRILGSFLEQCRSRDLEPGVDVGFLSYNETPMKKFIYKGISVVSTDFKQLGSKAAEFVTKDKPMQCYIPTELIIRESL
jgi:DNA-binding transcriptional regulator YhcF (GntR family)